MTTPITRARFLATLGGLIAAPFIAARALAAAKAAPSLPRATSSREDGWPYRGRAKPIYITILPVREFDENGVELHYAHSIKARQCGVRLWGAS